MVGRPDSDRRPLARKVVNPKTGSSCFELGRFQKRCGGKINAKFTRLLFQQTLATVSLSLGALE
jgi:hypothetical protein